MQNRQFF